MLLITERKKVGMICGHAIYAVSKSKMIRIPHSTVQSNMENSKNENRSFVHSACKCKMYLILVRNLISIQKAYSCCVLKLCWSFCCCFLVLIFHLILLQKFLQHIGQFYLEGLHYYGGTRSLYTVMVFGINVQVGVFLFF